MISPVKVLNCYPTGGTWHKISISYSDAENSYKEILLHDSLPFHADDVSLYLLNVPCKFFLVGPIP